MRFHDQIGKCYRGSDAGRDRSISTAMIFQHHSRQPGSEKTRRSRAKETSLSTSRPSPYLRPMFLKRTMGSYSPESRFLRFPRWGVHQRTAFVPRDLYHAMGRPYPSRISVWRNRKLLDNGAGLRSIPANPINGETFRGPATNDHYLPELRDQVQRATGAHRKRPIDPLLQLRSFVASVTRRIAAATTHAATAAATNARLAGSQQRPCQCRNTRHNKARRFAG